MKYTSSNSPGRNSANSFGHLQIYLLPLPRSSFGRYCVLYCTQGRTKWTSPLQHPLPSFMRGLHTLAPPRCRLAAISPITGCASPGGFYIIGKCQALSYYIKQLSGPYKAGELLSRIPRIRIRLFLMSLTHTVFYVLQVPLRCPCPDADTAWGQNGTGSP